MIIIYFLKVKKAKIRNHNYQLKKSTITTASNSQKVID